MISDAINDALKSKHLSPDDFSELLIRLLDHGVITRDVSKIETKLYDRFVQCEALVEDYLAPLKVRLQHDRKFCFVRVFPPGSVVPGLPDSDNDAFNSGFRVKPSQQDIAAILSLRVEYEKSIREGQVDEQGGVLVSIESIAITHNNLLKRPLPDNQSERAALFRRLRQLRLIDYNAEEDLSNGESWIRIQPSISAFVSNEVLSALYPEDSRTHARQSSDDKERSRNNKDPSRNDKNPARNNKEPHDVL